MIKNKHGFTIIEVLVVTVIIAIVSGLILLTYSKIQADSRNTERSSRMKIVAGALEKYYQKNGEYPGCTAMTQSGSQVSTNTLPGLDATALLTPTSPTGTTNSITGCSSMTSGTGGADTYSYVGDGSGTCSTGAACMQYTLQYREEGSGNIIPLQSEHQAQIAISGSPTLTATTASNTQINLSWPATSGALNYHLQQADDSGFTTNLVDSTLTGTSASATGLTPGELYYFRVQAISAITEGSWSNTANATTSISKPNTPTMSAGANVVGTASAVTCASGTAQYQLRARWQSNSGAIGAWTGWTGWSTTRTYSVGPSQGYDYDFQAHARCQGPDLASAQTADSNIASYVVPINTPATPAWTGTGMFVSMQNGWVSYATYCPGGTWVVNGTWRSHDWTGGYWGPYAFPNWDSWQNTDHVYRPVEYWGSYACASSYNTSPRSPESYNVINVQDPRNP